MPECLNGFLYINYDESMDNEEKLNVLNFLMVLLLLLCLGYYKLMVIREFNNPTP